MDLKLKLIHTGLDSYRSEPQPYRAVPTFFDGVDFISTYVAQRGARTAHYAN
jgi:hypothetical protein